MSGALIFAGIITVVVGFLLLNIATGSVAGLITIALGAITAFYNAILLANSTYFPSTNKGLSRNSNSSRELALM